MAEDILGRGWCWGWQVSEVCRIILNACQENSTVLVTDARATQFKWVFLALMLGKTWLEKKIKRKLSDILTCWKGQQVKWKSGQTQPNKDPDLTKSNIDVWRPLFCNFNLKLEIGLCLCISTHPLSPLRVHCVYYLTIVWSNNVVQVNKKVSFNLPATRLRAYSNFSPHVCDC